MAGLRRGLIFCSLWLCVAIFGMALPRLAAAQTNFSNTYATMDAAYSACYNYAANGASVGPCTYETATHWGITGNKFGKHWNTSGTDKAFHAKWTSGVGCSSGDTWVPSSTNPSTGSCANPNTQCEAIKARTEDPNDALFIGDNDFRTISGSGASQCLGGCTWAPRSGQPMVTTTSGGVSVTRASFGFTGLACTATAESPAPVDDKTPAKPVDQVCNVPSGTQLTMCKRQDGKVCYPTKFNGRQICWSSGETGTKTDGPIAQVRQPGNLASTTPPTPPPGETMVQQANTSPTPTTTTTTVNSTTTTTTTTTNNYVTQNGTNAGTSDSGTSASGSGGVSNDTGSGSASVGACDAPVSCSGDPIACAALAEAHKTRCAVEKSGNATISGGDADCTHEYTITGGDPVNVQLLVEAQRKRCQDKANMGVPDGDADGESDAEKGEAKEVTLGMSMLDETGMFGAQSCPDLGVADLGDWGTYDFNEIPYFCDFVAIVKGILILLGAWLAFRILAGA